MLPEQAEPGRRETTIQRIIRNTAVAMGVKDSTAIAVRFAEFLCNLLVGYMPKGTYPTFGAAA